MAGFEPGSFGVGCDHCATTTVYEIFNLVALKRDQRLHSCQLKVGKRQLQIISIIIVFVFGR